MEIIGNDCYLGRRFRLHERIGRGSFGDVYSATDTSTKATVAVKIDRRVHASDLIREHEIYQRIGREVGIPDLHMFEKSCFGNFLVMELVGSSLESLFQQCGRRFTMKTVLMLADQMIDRVGYLHSMHYLHRDIKPENFAMGIRYRSNLVYILDFGLSIKYYEDIHQRHVPWGAVPRLYSTPRYASVNALDFKQTSRRDDLESLGYCFMYFLLGRLPWQGMQAATKKQKYERISAMKKALVFDVLNQFPPEFAAYMRYVKRLHFDDQPDYQHLREIFASLFRKLNYEYDFWYDWDVNALRSIGRASPDISQTNTSPTTSPCS